MSIISAEPVDEAALRPDLDDAAETWLRTVARDAATLVTVASEWNVTAPFLLPSAPAAPTPPTPPLTPVPEATPF